MSLKRFSAIALGIWLGLSIAGCASNPLKPLLGRIESLPMHEWNYQSPTTAELNDIALRLRWAASYMGIKVDVNDEMAERELGAFIPERRQIWLNPKLSLDGQVYTVAHELGHALQPPNLTEEAREIFAECVAYLVIYPARDDKERFAKYMARYQLHARAVVKTYDTQIWWAARFLRMEGR